VYAQSPDTVYITGASSSTGQGMIAKSTNGGINWTKTFTTTNNVLKDIVFYNKNIGFTIGEKGILLKTTNGGIDWQLKTSGTTQNLNAIALTGLNNIWAVGDGGLVIHSTDDGETWQIWDLGLTSNLNDITFLNDSGYIVGSSSVIYKTINKGSVWAKEVIDNIELPYNNHQVSLTDHFVRIFGDQTTILQKENSSIWERKVSLYLTNGFAFIKDNIGYGTYAGIPTGSGTTNFKIFKTTNSGESWSDVYESWISSVDIYHSDISVVNDTVRYIVSGGAIFKSTPSTPITALNESLSDKAFVVFQNPLKNELTVKSNLQPILEIDLFNSSGKKVSMKRMNSKATETVVDISKLPIGVYLLKITLANNIQHVYKCIKN